MRHIYIFSGLGVDERVFRYLDFTGFDITFIKWIKPEANENIADYAKRLTTQIKTENPILIGLSLGGMMAMEIAKYMNIEKIILLASAKTCKEIPFYYRWAGYLKLHKILPAKLLKRYTFMSDWFFGTEENEHKAMLSEILKDLDEVFLRWAIDKIVYWKNQTIYPNIIHIHGDNDHILPLSFVNADIVIKGGGHFMTVTQAKELTAILKENLS
ncbi:alpha/beta fold hydrolase [Emticicia sp. BO119]|uniref:alpha/beta fold hydrolase n=1 Tax=Emticicia sp. BO119 TaxID=2757768 RepID=UPI0015F0E40E|nr:alpha/beta hydrolase [Emticicia sp. BO119]MBA4852450.1 alpha/beta hydrolase [Emticicia sp. BO119]